MSISLVTRNGTTNATSFSENGSFEPFSVVLVLVSHVSYAPKMRLGADYHYFSPPLIPFDISPDALESFRRHQEAADQALNQALEAVALNQKNKDKVAFGAPFVAWDYHSEQAIQKLQEIDLSNLNYTPLQRAQIQEELAMACEKKASYTNLLNPKRSFLEKEQLDGRLYTECVKTANLYAAVPFALTWAVKIVEYLGKAAFVAPKAKDRMEKAQEALNFAKEINKKYNASILSEINQKELEALFERAKQEVAAEFSWTQLFWSIFYWRG